MSYVPHTTIRAYVHVKLILIDMPLIHKRKGIVQCFELLLGNKRTSTFSPMKVEVS